MVRTSLSDGIDPPAEWTEREYQGSRVMSTKDRWYYVHGGQKQGPVSSAQLDRLANTGQLAPEDRIWLDGDDPANGLHARAAVDFSNLLPAVPRSSTAPTAFDVQTGLIHDPKQPSCGRKSLKPAQGTTALSVQEAYLKAKRDLLDWLDLERNRPLVLAGALSTLEQDPALRRFLESQRRYGETLVKKLRDYLAFMLKNRQAYHQELQRQGYR
jgi:hypothetical protein